METTTHDGQRPSATRTVAPEAVAAGVLAPKLAVTGGVTLMALKAIMTCLLCLEAKCANLESVEALVKSTA